MKQIADRHYFVGQGKKLGLELVLDEEDIIFYNDSKVVRFLESFEGSTLGLWKNEEGKLYVEPVLILRDEKLDGVDTLGLIKGLYPNEEAFYCAEIIGEEVSVNNDKGSLNLLLNEAVYKFKANEGMTLRLGKDNLWYNVIVVEGELVSNLKGLR